MSDRLTRRDFGRMAGLAGAGAALAGCSAESVGATRVAEETRTWTATGSRGAGLGGFDATMLTFMKARNISCGSLAVVRKGKLVLARGYTWSATPTLKTQPTSLFRIASVSKPITATAVLQLVKNGKLQLTDHLTDIFTLTAPAGKALDPRLKDITVGRLLQHLGGWDRDLSGDPMAEDRAIAAQLGVPLPVKKTDIVEYVNGLPLDHAPGTKFAYSNYGYMLLGQIIEKVSGVSYSAYVRQHVLGARKITRMKLGQTLTAATGEVPYYSQYTGKTVLDATGATVAAPYGTFNLENHSANGGWLGTAVDLVRFAGIFDSAGIVLDATSISRAFAEPETGMGADGSYYGAGWYVRPVTGGRNTWHTGSLPGTFTILVRRYDGLTWAALFDQRDDPSAKSYGDIDLALHKAADMVGTWPATDLYDSYF